MRLSGFVENEQAEKHAADFERLLATYGAALKRLCRAYLQDPADQQDLLQEILMAIWTALPRFRAEASERTWMYRIAHNVALTFSGKRRRRERTEEPIEEGVALAPAGNDPRRLALNQAIQRLTPVDRGLAALYLEGFSAPEMENITGMTANAIGVRLNRLRERLRRELLGPAGKGSES
jgi:RNA polymerase sigma-70 factor (ECF subfamily)